MRMFSFSSRVASPLAMVAVPTVVLGLLGAAPAKADCTSSAGVTLCSQGDVRGSNTGDGPSGAGPYYPYPCEDDYLCNDYGGVGVIFDLDPGIGRPDGPDRPNRPDRPGGRGGRR